MKRLAISFSGGRTSAVMTKLCFDKFAGTHEIIVCFANTGCEHPATLEFVRKCDEHFGWNVVWIEAVVDPRQGKGIRHKVVDFKSASRNGEPLRNDFAKHGLPGPGWLHCTRDTKELPIHSYLKSCGWEKGSYWTAIGIRADEIDRVSAKRLEHKFVYPLVDAGWDKDDVGIECAKWPFDLELPGDHYGNCQWCWKKSLRKLMTLAVEDESVFDFCKDVERDYSHITSPNDPNDTRKMFRGNMDSGEIIERARLGGFAMYKDTPLQDKLFSVASFDVDLDTGSSCGESCEIGADEMPSTPYRDSLKPSSIKFDGFKDFGSCSGGSWDTGADE
jgi:hypothetical protein